MPGYNSTESIPRVKQRIGWIMNVKTQSAHKDIVYVGTWTFFKLLVFLGDKRDIQMIEKGAEQHAENLSELRVFHARRPRMRPTYSEQATWSKSIGNPVVISFLCQKT